MTEKSLSDLVDAISKLTGSKEAALAWMETAPLPDYDYLTMNQIIEKFGLEAGFQYVQDIENGGYH